ncbi:MAG: hypothetical protein AABW54_02270 [Candidatus Micrarchaeota archaeon]
MDLFKDIAYADLSPQNMGAALEHGDVDAVFIWEPVASKLRSGMPGRVSVITPNESRWVVIVYVSKQFSQDKQAQEKFMRALLKAEDFVKQRPKDAMLIVAKETALDEATLREVWPSFSFGLSEFKNRTLLENEARWAMRSNLTNANEMPDFARYIDNTAVAKVLSGR